MPVSARSPASIPEFRLSRIGGRGGCRFVLLIGIDLGPADGEIESRSLAQNDAEHTPRRHGDQRAGRGVSAGTAGTPAEKRLPALEYPPPCIPA